VIWNGIRGLLIPDPLAGWAVLAGIAIRMTALRIKGAAANSPIEVLAAGFIAGDALFGFFDSVLKTKPPTGNDGPRHGDWELGGLANIGLL
jgi:uncharacterized oligopeptide transporter (OPT) family protein